MFKSKTVFVVGAGASKEAGLPIGSELTDSIARLLNFSSNVVGRLEAGDYEIYQSLRNLAQRDSDWADNRLPYSGRELSDAMRLAQSIDTFLQSHRANREFVLLGKLGIVRAIALAESKSKMASREVGRPFDLSNLSDTWYFALARMLFSGVPADQPQLAFENVTFIVFNYDRCLQVFLVRAAETFFRIERAQAERLINSVTFIHPYGSLGDIFQPNNDRIAFGSEHLDLIATASSIKTFSEQSDLRTAITQEVFDAEKIIFLGFGFHDQNMEILDISENVAPSATHPATRIFATTHGLSESDEQLVRSQIAYAFLGKPIDFGNEHQIVTKNATCAQFFGSYWRSLAS